MTKKNSTFEQPWWYKQIPRDFMSSPDVQIMEAEEIGSYFLLLQHSWLLGDNCTLPNDPARLAKLARVAVVSELVLSKFHTDKNGRLYNPRLSAEWKEALNRSKQGKNAVNARWGKDIQENYGSNTPVSLPNNGSNTTNTNTNTQTKTKKNKKLKTLTTYTSESESANAVPSSASPSTPAAPSEEAAKLVQKLVGILGRSDHKPGTLLKFAAEVQPLVTKHGFQTVTDVMDFALVNNRDGFWRGRVYAMCNFVKCFNSMHKQMKKGVTGTRTGGNPLAARAASLSTGADFSHLAKGDL
jgi:uncharacterized protein YdaU (DUF1376 family)